MADRPGWLVPWMAYSPPASARAATPIGLRGEPPGMTFGRFGWSRLTIGRRRPGRAAVFRGDARHAGPALAVAADADRIADRLAVAEKR